MEIRPYRESDREAAIDLILARSPHVQRSSLEDSLDSEHVVLSPSLLAVDDAERPVAWGVVVEHSAMPEGHRFVHVTVATEAEGCGLGSRLHAMLVGSVGPDVTQLGANLLDDDERSLAIAKHWGFEPYQHGYTSRFELVDLPEPEHSVGLTLDSCGDLVFNDRDAVVSMLAVSQTNPEADEGFFVTLGGLAAFSSQGIPVGVLARIDDVPAGLIHGWVKADMLNIAYLCVRPDLRGRGIALALKQQLHLEAQRSGAIWLLTTNEEKNTAIRAMNAKLGYQIQFGEIRLKLER